MRNLWLGFLLCHGGLAPAQAPLDVTGLPADAPLAVTAFATSEVLVVELSLQPEWHVYAHDVGGGQPVSVELADGCDFAAGGELRMPPDDGGKLTGTVRLRLPLVAKGRDRSLRAEVGLMVCDPLACLPPMTVRVAGDVPTCSVLLVVDEEDERSARIATFLGERGFEVAVTTYPTVTAEECDSRDVVLADSKLFGKGAKVRQHVRNFPATKTPIVAVGFYGTELVEAHGIAMTSGYI